MNILISLNGLFEYNSYVINYINNFKPDYVICADGGVKHAQKLNLTINMVVGDMDSISDEHKNILCSNDVKVKKCPPEKDETDGEIAVLEALKLNPSKILILGATGGRIDHQIANLHLLGLILSHKIEAAALGENCVIKLINQNYCLKGKKGDLVSIFPFGGETVGIDLIGFKYGLNNAKMVYGKTIGISNVMESEESIIRLKYGELIVIHYS